MKPRLLHALLLVAVFVSRADAGGGSTPGASHKNCATTEATINADGHTIMCDDFELKGNGTTPGAWFTVGCDATGTGGSGEAATESKGWCGQPASNPNTGPFTNCGGAGANGTACTARSVLNGDAEALATHNFGASCATAGLNCTNISGVSHYDEVFFRFMIKFLTGWSGAPSGNQKILTINPSGFGTGGILIGGLGMPFGDGHLVMCPVIDCNYTSEAYRNAQALGNGVLCGGVFPGVTFTSAQCAYLGQNAGNGIIDVLGSRLGRWTIVEGYIKLNTANTRNGLWKMWADDCGVAGTTCPGTLTLRSNYTNVVYRGNSTTMCGSLPPGAQCVTGFDNSTSKIGAFFLDTWTGPSGQGSSGTIQVDQIVVSTQAIGTVGSAPPMVLPPAAPTGLTVGPS